MKKALALFAVLLISGAFVGCDDVEDTEPEAMADEASAESELDEADDDSDDEAGEAVVDEAADQADDESEAAGDEFDYPGFALDDLDDAGRAELANLGESELCPCEGSTVSLHECMQEEEEDRCAEADEEATRLMGVVADAGDAEDDAVDRLAADRAEDEAPSHDFRLEGAPHKGSADADVIIVEFADFLCPHCQRAAQAMDEVYEAQGDDVGIFFKNFPVGGAVAEQAAQAAIAAGEQGRFWEMHQLLFANQRQIDGNQINHFARQIGLDAERFQRDMEGTEVQEHVQRDRFEGVEAGVTGTPAIFINGQRYTGNLTGAAINSKVDSLLDE